MKYLFILLLFLVSCKKDLIEPVSADITFLIDDGPSSAGLAIGTLTATPLTLSTGNTANTSFYFENNRGSFSVYRGWLTNWYVIQKLSYE